MARRPTLPDLDPGVVAALSRELPSAAPPPPAGPPGPPGAGLLRRLAVPAAGAVLGGLLVLALVGGPAPTQAPAAEARGGDNAAQAERLELLERRLAALEARALRPVASSHQRFLAAALHLQAAVATSRPYLREFEALLAAAPPGLVAAPFGEVLASHAARGIATEGELRDRFLRLAVALRERDPNAPGVFGALLGGAQALLARIGLAEPPPADAAAAAIERIGSSLRQGDLAAAVSDAASLDPSATALLSGWLAQARARLAVEQAVRETVLRGLAHAEEPA